MKDGDYLDICSVNECNTNDNKTIKYKGIIYCMRHYNQMRMYGEIKRVKLRKSVPKNSECHNCGGKVKGYYKEELLCCSKCYDQLRLFGYIKDRKLTDKNEIILMCDYAEMILYDVSGNEKGRTIFDLEDVDVISKYIWNLGSNGYAMNTLNSMCIHNLLFKYDKSLYMLDHINRDRLDNRRNNLRLCKKGDNSINRSISTSNTSGIIGVSYDKKNDSWTVNIQIGKDRFNKRFKIKENAIITRLILERDYFGEFAPQSHLFEEYNIMEHENMWSYLKSIGIKYKPRDNNTNNLCER